MTTRQLLKLDEDEPVRQICHTRNNKHVKFYGSRLYMSQSIWKYLNFKFVNLRVLSGAGNGGLERLLCPQMRSISALRPLGSQVLYSLVL